MKKMRTGSIAFGMLLVLGCGVTYAQIDEELGTRPDVQSTIPPGEAIVPAQPTVRPALHMGWETGADMFAGRNAENALYLGVHGGNQMVAFRTSFFDSGPDTPCSFGVMYEYAAHRSDTTRIQPMFGLSASHYASCSAQDGPEPVLPFTSTETLSGGIRIPVMTAQRVAASLKIQGYVGRRFARDPAADLTTSGVVVGVTFHAP